MNLNIPAAALVRSSLFALALLLITGCAHEAHQQPSAAKADVSVALAPEATKSPKAAPTPAPDLASNPPPQAVVANPELPTIFIAGDSTAARGTGEAQQGWGVPFADYFDRTKVNVVNRARGGRSSRTFITEGLWDRVMADAKKGDIVLIQFGHNDAGAVNDMSRARGSLPGLGEETQEIDNLLTKKHEVVHTFGSYMRKMIADTKAKGATPMVLSLTVRNVWKNGKVERGSGRYSRWSAEIAKGAQVQFIDVTDLVADKFDEMGPEKVGALYPRDHTHFNAVGADIHASTVVSGLKGLRPDPVKSFLSAKGEAVQFDPFGWLNLPRPANPTLPTLFLIGDSTVRNGRGNGAGGQWGWGDYLGRHFAEDKLNVVNRAVGGTSSRTFLTTGYWERVLAMMKPGDYVMMQFGHNDNGSPTNPPPGRTSIKGIGEDTVEAVDPKTGKQETVHTFGWYLRKYIVDTRSKGATPIVCSLVPRKTWKEGKVARNKETHAGWAEAVAKAEGVPFVDLNEIIAAHYDELGPEKVNPLFADEHTHTSATGAELNADCVVEGLKALTNDPLDPYLTETK
jgi:lysophospholipase L1-like esterase